MSTFWQLDVYIRRLVQLDFYEKKICLNLTERHPVLTALCFIFILAGMIWLLATLLLVVSVSSTTVEEAQVEDGQERDAKFLPIFQVVRFPVSLLEIPKHSNTKKLKLS